LRDVLALDPSYTEARNNLALLLRNRGLAAANQDFATGAVQPTAATDVACDPFVVAADAVARGSRLPEVNEEPKGGGTGW
jgi:hypothetical protein